MRVIAGEAGGLRLVAPRSIRPTTDRAREGLFGALGARVTDAAVLDLFAGSGALAIEALSRGAARAVLVDDDAAAVDACEQNLATTGLAGRASVLRAPAERFLAAGPPPEAPFDLVFSDPPYEESERHLTTALQALSSPGWCVPDAWVVVEQRAGRGGAGWPLGWSAAWERKYGDTLMTALVAV
jgi:16S rRNA (guanine966-N2)-methyltransferase